MSKPNQGWEKMVDRMPADAFAERFRRVFIKLCIEKWGDIIPNDLYELDIVAHQSLAWIAEQEGSH